MFSLAQKIANIKNVGAALRLRDSLGEDETSQFVTRVAVNAVYNLLASKAPFVHPRGQLAHFARAKASGRYFNSFSQRLLEKGEMRATDLFDLAGEYNEQITKILGAEAAEDWLVELH